MGCFGAKCVVWGAWLLNLLVSAVYLGISLVSFHNVQEGVKYLRDFENQQAYKDSLLGACMMGFLLVLFWICFSFFVLLGRFFTILPLGYGIMLGTCSHTAFFMLLAGLVLQTHENLAEAFKVNRIWSEKDYQTYVATYVFSYVLTGTYLLMFILLLVTKGSMSKKSERSESYKAKPSVSQPSSAAAPATTGSASAVAVEMPPANHGFGANWGGSYGRNI